MITRNQYLENRIIFHPGDAPIKVRSNKKKFSTIPVKISWKFWNWILSISISKESGDFLATHQKGKIKWGWLYDLPPPLTISFPSSLNLFFLLRNVYKSLKLKVRRWAEELFFRGSLSWRSFFPLQFLFTEKNKLWKSGNFRISKIARSSKTKYAYIILFLLFKRKIYIITDRLVNASRN